MTLHPRPSIAEVDPKNLVVTHILRSVRKRCSVRKQRMDRVNPKYILRNYLAQIAISKAQQERDFSEIDQLLQLLARPYDEQAGMESYAAPAPEWASKLEISCSS